MTTQQAQQGAEQRGGNLSTLNDDGSRRWLKPRVSPGRFIDRRRYVAWALILIFTAIPYIPINGKPAILLDITAREFTFFGMTFLPTDTLLLALFMAGVFVTIFLATALFGRVWCGWACPQTVYMEFIYRPLERLFTGAPGRKKNRLQASAWGSALKYISYILVSLFLAHTFLAYFVGIDSLVRWIGRSPLDHPTSFLVIVIVTGLILFDFGFFREQTCIVACPYGRFQSVMLDRASLIVTYDPKRGEPRGKMRRTRKPRPQPVDLTISAPPQTEPTPEPELGDCIDCRMCVTTCPTGIDIRDGLQMECIGCAQCIDACDAVMEKIGRPLGLIRYSTQEAIESGRARILRPRVVIYPLFLAIIAGLFVATLTGKQPVDVTILREQGLPYVSTDGGVTITNNIKIKLVNRSDETRAYRVTIAGAPGAYFEGVAGDDLTIQTAPRSPVTRGVAVTVPREAFTGDDGLLPITIRVESEDGSVATETPYRLIGPRGAPPAQP